MGHDWIIDVLADVRTYARANGLDSLAVELEEAAQVAESEIASKAEDGTFGIHVGYTKAGQSARTFRAS